MFDSESLSHCYACNFVNFSDQSFNILLYSHQWDYYLIQDATLLPKWKAFQTVIFLERVRLMILIFFW